MNEISCLGLSFLAKCSATHYAEHFLFNFEVAVSSLAIIVSIYALFLERRFRARIAIKGARLKWILGLILGVLVLTFVGAVLPYMPGSPLPLLGYPAFWEIVAAILLCYAILESYILVRPIKTLTKEQIASLVKYAPHSTLKYHGSLDLILKEAESFWTDFLTKSMSNRSLKEVLLSDFSQKDFLSVAAKSPYILWDTLEFVEKSKPTDNTEHVKSFLRDLILTSLIQEESIIADDLESSYKPLMQEIIRKKKLSTIIFDSTELFLLRLSENTGSLKILKRFVDIFDLYLGRRYHYTEDTTGYIGLIDADVLKTLLEFFKDNLHFLDKESRSKFLSELSFHSHELKDLPKEQSEALADGVYEILETYASGKDWSKDRENERLICIRLERNYVSCNQYTKRVFKQRLLEQIVGTEDEKKITHFTYNLGGFYPMMIPVYFFIYGYSLFTKKVPTEDIDMHMTILKKMKENLPIIASGRSQEFIDEANMPKNQRGIDVIRKKAEECLESMFPENVLYDKETNAITYIFGNEESSSTILLNETFKEGKFVYKEE